MTEDRDQVSERNYLFRLKTAVRSVIGFARAHTATNGHGLSKDMVRALNTLSRIEAEWPATRSLGVGWTLESSGALRLDGTPFTVVHNPLEGDAEYPGWLARRDGKQVFGIFGHLEDAKAECERYAAELRDVGLLDEVK